MKKLIFVICILALFQTECNDESSIIETTLNSDDILKTKLIGNWANGRTYNVTYFSDDTFIDSTFRQNPVDTNQYLLTEARKGKYSITNGILDNTHIHYSFFDSTIFSSSVSIISTPYEIEINGNRLVGKPVDVLTSIDSNVSDLLGKWTMTKWAYHRVPNFIYEGGQKYTYTFFQDSSNFHYGWEYLDPSPWSDPSFQSDFTYDPPILNMPGPGFYNVNVVFKFGNKMYWYYPYPFPELSLEKLN